LTTATIPIFYKDDQQIFTNKTAYSDLILPQWRYEVAILVVLAPEAQRLSFTPLVATLPIIELNLMSE